MAKEPKHNMQGFSEASGKPSFSGHRDRLRQRFRKGGADAMPDYELLEMVLFRALPRRDTKPIAKALIERFGSFANVVNAAPERLAEIEGVGDKVITEIQLITAAALRLVREEAKKEPVFSTWDKLIEYCHAAMAHEDTEQFRILFLDKKHRLIADEVQQKGTIDHTPVYPREVVKRALDLYAAGIILVHNHPSGDPMPSKSDIEMTKNIVDTAIKLKVKVLDHIIIAKEGHTSFKAIGLI